MSFADKNDDKQLSEAEFIELPLGDQTDEAQRKLDKQWQKERQEEFRSRIDSNHDGVVTEVELLVSTGFLYWFIYWF